MWLYVKVNSSCKYKILIYIYIYITFLLDGYILHLFWQQQNQCLHFPEESTYELFTSTCLFTFNWKNTAALNNIKH